MKRTLYNKVGETLWSDTLPNGLAVRVVTKPGYTGALGFLAVNYGGAHRRFGLNGVMEDTPAGIAHFLEHKMFDMPDGSSALTSFSRRGAAVNAFTTADTTAYHFSCTGDFEENLRELLRFVSTPFYTPESVAKEQGIIAQEIRMRLDSPGAQVYQDFYRLLYPHHPIREPVIGSVESIAGITADTLYNCHRVFYNPSNMILCCIGDIDPQLVSRVAREVLPAEKEPVPVRDFGGEDSLFPAERYFQRSMEVSAPQFYLGAAVPPADRGRESLHLTILGELTMQYLAGESSPLSSGLYSQGKINSPLSYGFLSAAGTAAVAVAGEAARPEEVLEALNREISQIGEKGFDLGLFNRVKKAYYGAELRGLGRFDSLARSLTRGYFSGYCPLDVFAELETVTPEECAAFAVSCLSPNRLVLSVVRPNE